MQGSRSGSSGSRQRSADHVAIKVAILVLVVACPLVLVAGVGLTQDRVVNGPIVHQDPSLPLPVPQQVVYFNRSVGVGATAEVDFTHVFVTNGTLSSTANVSGITDVGPPPETEAYQGDLFYVYFGFMLRNGVVNYSLYNAGGTVVDRNSVEAQGNVATGYVLEEANNNGTYRFFLQNAGKSPLNVTLYVGSTETTWSKRYFFVGVELAIAGVAMAATLVVLLVIWARRTKRT